MLSICALMNTYRSNTRSETQKGHSQNRTMLKTKPQVNLRDICRGNGKNSARLNIKYKDYCREFSKASE